MNSIVRIVIAIFLFGCGGTAYASSPLLPVSIKFDESLNEARERLRGLCKEVSEEVISPAQIPNTKDRQLQINCEGYLFQGKTRKAEFIFRDGELMLVWILTTAEEEKELESWMRSVADPDFVASEFTAFTNQNMALRKVPHEVLFYSDTVAPMFKAWFSNAVKTTN